MKDYQIRTDLALEATEEMKRADAEHMHGIAIEEYRCLEEVRVTKVMIKTRNAAKSMGKPVGTYITVEAPSLQEDDEEYHASIAKELARELKDVLPDIHKEKSVLVVGLGNRDVTADALGPSTVDNLNITRHILREYGKQAYSGRQMHSISSLIPGVMAKTGMETLEIVKGVIKETKPDIVIVIDALAARSTKRLSRTVQISDAGIQPGSGVGNHRDALCKDSLGIPVIAIGVPMVVDAQTIVVDALEEMTSAEDVHARTICYRARENSQLHNMYVTTKNIDEITKRLSETLAEAINIALSI
ncbi:MAG: GPR endopeptidase [Lachnospiraceae bacterium]|nr:GPR endopeptidase [Lachnospiraceae bacterium]